MNLKVNKISDAEAEIMRVVWEHPGPVTYSYIRTVLTQQKNWESPTVNTLVKRLVKKGALIQEKERSITTPPSYLRKNSQKRRRNPSSKKVYGGSVKV